MKTRHWGGIGIVLVGCAAAIACVTYGYQTVPNGPVAPEVAPAGGSDQPFYDDLAPYGRWVYSTGPGWVWSPYNVQAGWRPYVLGHWVFTDYGWTWASDEQWGWAVYHYGRWHQDPSYGWVWVPGTEWGPAWVAWHEGGGYVGWAPLPWQVRVQAGVGLDWAGVNVSLQPSSWCFVSARNLVDPGLQSRIVPAARNVTLIQVTQNVTNYTYVNNRVVNQGVRVEAIGKAVGHTIPRYRVAETDSPETTRGGKVRGQDFVVFRQDPRRGRNSQGRANPPGHDERERPRDLRGGQGQPEPPPTGAQPAPPPQASTPTEPPPTDRGQEKQNRGHESRGRKFLEAMTGQQPPGRSRQDAPPAQPATPTQPSNAPAQPSTTTPQPPGATTPPANARTGHPAPGDQQGATTPPARPEPSKGQSAREKVKDLRNAGSKDKKPKQDAPKDNGSDPDKSKGQNGNSDH